MHIVYCSDDNYARIMSVSIVSLLENNKAAEELIIYCISVGISEEMQRELIEIVSKYNRTLNVIDAKEACREYRVWPENEDGYYARLFIPEVVDEDKALYLDCDTVIAGSLEELWNTDISGYWLGAVQDIMTNDGPQKEADMSQDDSYFNSGVMLININAWRENKLMEKFLEFKKNHPNNGLFRDQRVLNGTCVGHVLFLEPRYNVMHDYAKFLASKLREISYIPLCYEDGEFVQARNSPVIIHYTNYWTSRPWYSHCNHPFKGVYEKYRLMTPTPPPVLRNSPMAIFKELLKSVLPFPIYLMIRRINRILITKRKQRVMSAHATKPQRGGS